MTEKCTHINTYLSLLGIRKFSRIIPLEERKRTKKISLLRKDHVLTLGHAEATEVMCNSCKQALSPEEVKELTGISLYEMPLLIKQKKTKT